MPSIFSGTVTVSELPWLAGQSLLHVAKSSWASSNLLQAAGGLAFVALSVWLLAKFLSVRRRYLAEDPQRLFRDLCRAHRLRWRQVRLLRSIVKIERVDPPARLFLEPRRFRPGIETQLACSQQEIEQLRERLFGNLAS